MRDLENLKINVCITMHPHVRELARELIQAGRAENFSALVGQLVRNEYDARFGPDKLQEAKHEQKIENHHGNVSYRASARARRRAAGSSSKAA